MLSTIRNKNINCEQEAKFIQDRINGVEKNLGELCCIFSAYSRKAARLRDKGDAVSKIILAYAEGEDVNKSLSNGLIHFANIVSIISDYGDIRVQNIDKKVVNVFAQYETLCKNVKDEVRQIYSIRSKEISRKRQLDRARERNPKHRHQIIQAETELAKASAEVTKTINNLEEQIMNFEKQKLHDVKTILLDYIGTEMGYHAKCLELLTKAYKDINNIDEQSDMEEFKRSLRIPDMLPQMGNKKSLFRGSQSLGSLSSLFSTPKKKHPGILVQLTPKSKRVSRSEEILGTFKNYSESESEAYVSEENSEDNDTENLPQFTARKYLK